VNHTPNHDQLVFGGGGGCGGVGGDLGKLGVLTGVEGEIRSRTARWNTECSIMWHLRTLAADSPPATAAVPRGPAPL
jgi:hypothetical protein